VPHPASYRVSRSRAGPLGPPDRTPATSLAARIYIRRNADPAAIKRIERYLKSRHRADYAFGQRGAWTIIDVAAADDLQLIRKQFYRLIDGWQELS
jgi:hypothetical protein